MSGKLFIIALVLAITLPSLCLAHNAAQSDGIVLAPFYDINCTDRVPYPEVAENPNVTLLYDVECNSWYHDGGAEWDSVSDITCGPNWVSFRKHPGCQDCSCDSNQQTYYIGECKVARVNPKSGTPAYEAVINADTWVTCDPDNQDEFGPEDETDWCSFCYLADWELAECDATLYPDRQPKSCCEKVYNEPLNADNEHEDFEDFTYPGFCPRFTGIWELDTTTDSDDSLTLCFTDTYRELVGTLSYGGKTYTVEGSTQDDFVTFEGEVTEAAFDEEGEPVLNTWDITLVLNETGYAELGYGYFWAYEATFMDMTVWGSSNENDRYPDSTIFGGQCMKANNETIYTMNVDLSSGAPIYASDEMYVTEICTGEDVEEEFSFYTDDAAYTGELIEGSHAEGLFAYWGENESGFGRFSDDMESIFFVSSNGTQVLLTNATGSVTGNNMCKGPDLDAASGLSVSWGVAMVTLFCLMLLDSFA